MAVYEPLHENVEDDRMEVVELEPLAVCHGADAALIPYVSG
jgi:hypothetical protein